MQRIDAAIHAGAPRGSATAAVTLVPDGLAAAGISSPQWAAMSSHAPRRAAGWGRAAVWCLRALLLTPFVLMGPELLSALLGRPDAVSNLSASTADVLGSSALLMFIMMLAVTPIHTATGWRWHIILRRDYGLGMFAAAVLDLVLAATTTGNTFPGGVLARVGGHTFLVAGLLSTLLLVPLALTANGRAQRWMGGAWKWLHRLTYVVWGTVLLHLLLLFGVGTIFVDGCAVSLPLLVLRVPAVRRWWVVARRQGTRPWARLVAGMALAGVFAAGYVPLIAELALKGGAAFTQNPGNN